MRRTSRMREIQKQLQNNGSVYVASLAETLHVSDVTIRKDLAMLEEQGVLKRTHGGGIAVEPPDPSGCCLLSREALDFREELTGVAKAASSLVQEGDNVFIGCGETCAAIARSFVGCKANFVTNSLLVASILCLNHNAVIRVTGGTLSGPDRSLLGGELFTESMQHFYFKYAYLCPSGADLHAGYTTAFLEHTDFETVRRVTENMVFGVSWTKFGKTSLMQLGPLDMADIVACDQEPPAEFRAFYDEHKIRVLLP